MTDGNHKRGCAALQDHVENCERCLEERPSWEGLVARLSRAAAPELDAAALSQSVHERLAPELERLRDRAWRKRVALALLPAMVPLPAVIAVDVWLLGRVHILVETLLPAALASMITATQGAFLALLFASTYAAIPLLLDWRTHGRRK